MANPEDEEQGLGSPLPVLEVKTGTPEWARLCPTRGQVIEVWMPATSRPNAPEGWAAFLVMGTAVTSEKDVALDVKSLGSLFPELDKEHSKAFNRTLGRIHLCSSTPCVAADEYTLHATHVRVFNLEGYAAVWYSASTRRQVEKWLAPLGEAPGEGELGAPGGEVPKVPGSRRKKESAKEPPGASAKKVPGGRKEDSVGPEFPGVISESVVAGIRGKLHGLRSRVKGREPVRPPPPGAGLRSVSIDVPSSGEDDSFPALEDGLQTGMDLRTAPARKKVKSETRLKKRKKKEKDAKVLVATSGNTTRNLQGQLASSAVAALQGARDGQKKKRKKSSAEKMGEALAKALAPLGLKKVKKEKKRKKDKKEKKRKKRRGDPSSSGGTSSSEESYSEYSEQEEESLSSEEMEAPMVKRSRERPGSVLELLVQHARAQLDQSSAVSLPSEVSRVDQGIKILSYFQVILKPQLGSTTGAVREMFVIATVLDLLRKGQLSQVGDTLAARFFALHQSQLDGNWQAARHLEIHSMDEATSTTTAVLLQTRRHARMAAKAQGLDFPGGGWTSGWGRGRSGKGGKNKWSDGDWKGGQSKGGKGKEKGKKGRGGNPSKGQGDKTGDWSQKETPAEK